MPVTISSAFDSGNIERLPPLDDDGSTGPLRVRLALRKDAGDTHMQWFHFRVGSAAGRDLELRIENAGKASYPPGWTDYRACVSVDRQQWTRVQATSVEDGQLVIRLRPQADAVWLAYFAPYSNERHLDLVARCVASGRARHRVIGHSLDGRELDLVELGTGPRQLWFIGRQHPGESMASWWMEGFLGRLLDPADAQVRRLLAQATISCVPLVNPDGAFRGYLRTNASGANLNREWAEPTLSRSPEVLHLRDEMDRVGVDLCLDVHGDEALPYVFLSGAEGIAGWSDRLASLSTDFLAAWMQSCPDLQAEHGYPPAGPGQANMTMCTNQVAQRFDCLAYTLEMPFKDNALAPDPVHGWSPARCERLGASVVDPVVQLLPRLR